MSHFTVAVITTPESPDVNLLLEPFNEEIVVEPYVYETKKKIIEDLRKNIKEHIELKEEYGNDYEEYFKTFSYIPDTKTKENFLKRHRNRLERQEWTDEELYTEYREQNSDRDFDDEGNLLSTYNPESQWDWYAIGGRWEGLIQANGEYVDTAPIKDIENKFVTYAVITPDGEWYSKGKMGWWGMSSETEEEGKIWEEEYWEKFILAHKERGTVTIVDCHI